MFLSNDFLEISTPKSPPNNPPIIVLEFKRVNKAEILKVKIGFSKKATILEPKKAPIAAPNTIESLFKFGIESVECFLRKM